jgi:hypothetical protein
LSEFFADVSSEEESSEDINFSQNFRINNSKGHTSIGVQKGSTLMKALSAVRMPSSNTHGYTRPISASNINSNHSNAAVFDVLKKQRRDSIINIIKTISGGATIKDIKDRAKLVPEKYNSLVSCSEKTLQRELVSMVKSGVLDRIGEKRWSKYFMK